MNLNPWKLSTLTLAGVLAFSTFGPLAFADQQQPHMQAALESLKTAREKLKSATSDKGGHRVKALELTNAAIEQVEKGIAYDNEHKGDKKDAEEAAPEELSVEAR